MPMIHVVHMSSVHFLADPRILNKECMTLAQAGYKVSIVIPHPCDETVGPIAVHAIPRLQGRLNRFIKTTSAAFRKAWGLNAAIYHIHDPELIPFGILLKILGKKVIYDVHEDLPLQIRSKEWIPCVLRQPVAWFAYLLELVGAWFFDGIVAATPAIARRFSAAKTAVVQNFPMLEEFSATASQPYSARPRQLTYVGSVTRIRGIFAMLDTVEQLHDKTIFLSVAGHIQNQRLQQEIERHPAWTRVHYHGWLSRAGVAALIGQSRIGLVLLHPCANYLESYPVKLFEYMAAGIPVVASNFPLWCSVINDARCGLTVDPESPKQISEAITWLMEHELEAATMGERGRQAVLKTYNWQSEATKLLALYASVRASA